MHGEDQQATVSDDTSIKSDFSFTRGDDNSIRSGYRDTQNDRRPATVRNISTAQSQGNILSRFGGFLSDSWHGEFAAILSSVAALVAIAIVSLIYDGKPVPSLPKGITLNAVNSVLATTAKSALLFSVASNISQWKWLWYKREKLRSLGQIQVFDDASRGPLGALQLCLGQSRTSLGLIGALITLLALAFDPFIQQLLVYPTDIVYKPSNLSWTRQAYVVQQQALIDGGIALDCYPPQYLENALWSNDSTVFARKPVCASTNCTWDTFTSLGFCSECEDVSHIATVSNCDARPYTFDNYSTYNMTLPINGGPILNKTCNITFGLGLVAPITLSTYLWSTGYWYLDMSAFDISEIYVYDPEPVSNNKYIPNSMTVLDHADPQVVVGAATLGVDKGMIQVLTAQICTLDLCVRDYDISVKDGVTSVNVSGTKYGNKFQVRDPADTEFCWTAAQVPFDPGALINTTFDGNNTYRITDQGHQDFAFCYQSSQGFLAGSLNDYVDGSYLSTIIACTAANCTEGETFPNISYDIFESEFGWSSSSTKRIHSIGLPAYMDNLAESLTQLALDFDEHKVWGKVGVMVMFVRVQWLWLILPAALEVAGLVFLLITGWASRKHKLPLWKASLWPLLFRGLDREIPVLEDDVSHMQITADEVDVRLKHDDECHLVLGS